MWQINRMLQIQGIYHLGNLPLPKYSCSSNDIHAKFSKIKLLLELIVGWLPGVIQGAGYCRAQSLFMGLPTPNAYLLSNKIKKAHFVFYILGTIICILILHFYQHWNEREKKENLFCVQWGLFLSNQIQDCPLKSENVS